MDEISVTFAKLAGLSKVLNDRLAGGGRLFDPISVTDYFERYNKLAHQLVNYLPELYGDLTIGNPPEPNKSAHNNGRGYFGIGEMLTLRRDIDYIIEVRANSRIGEKTSFREEKTHIFISHGRSTEWYKLQAFVERDLEYKTIELAQQPNIGRTVLQKLDEESNKCFAAIIAMTGDDLIQDGEVRARENVMHEIGFFQGKMGLSNIVLLHEEGVNIPSNIHGLVYVPFPKGTIEATFGALQREIKVISA